MNLKKAIACALSILSISLLGLSACGEGGEEMNILKIQCKTYAGQTIDCTSPVYQTYLSLTDEKDIAKYLLEHNNKGNFKPVPQSGCCIKA